MNRRIGLFIPSLGGGSAKRAMVTLANGFAQRGYNVDLALAKMEGPYLKDVSPAVRIVDLKAGLAIKSLVLLARYLLRDRPEAMLSAMNHANVVAIMARALSGIPTRIVVSEHSTISVESAHNTRHLNARAVYALVPWLYRTADRIVAVSRGVARDLERFAVLPTGSVQTIYNPFDLKRIGQLAVEAAPHPWLQTGGTDP